MRGRFLELALGLFAIAIGPLALEAWNRGIGQSGFATPVGGNRWFSTRSGFFDTRNIRDPELSPTGSVFNWANEGATIRFSRLNRSRPSVVTLRIQGAESRPGTSPEVILAVDGVEAQRLPVPKTPRRVSVTLPKRQGRGALLSIKVEGSVGLMVENVRLSPLGGSLPVAREAVAAMAFVGLAWYAAALLAGAAPPLALALAMAPTLAFSWLAFLGGAFLGRYSETIAWLTAAVLVWSLILSRIKNLLWRRVAIAVLGLSVMKLAILSHPQITDADAAFHAGNLRRVLAGDWFFTSATPPPAIAFPYPPGLSVVALPFSGLPQDTWVPLLRVIVVVTETLAAASFAVAIATLWSEVAGALTFLFLALSPEATALLFVGNLANLFSDALLLFGFTFIITRRAFVGSLSLLGGFLSHFGALLFGAPLSFLLALNQGETLSGALRRTLPVLAAIGASFVLYYWRFLSVVMDAWERMAYLKGPAATGPMTAPIAEKLSRMGFGEGFWITAVVGLTVVIGMAAWPRNLQPLARILFIWLLVVTGFVLLGLLTPVQVRSGLAARPALAVLCASGTFWLWSRGGGARILAAALVLAIAAGCWVTAMSFFPARAL